MGAEELPSAKDRAPPLAPTSQFFSEGNGGESRHSFHGYPKGYAQLIHSPETWKITPMNIDTRNRDCGANYTDVHNCSKFIPGIEPRSSRFFRGIPKGGTNYSGLLECPCNSRFGADYGNKTKIVDHEFVTVNAGNCPVRELPSSAAACFDASMGLNLGRSAGNKTLADAAKPRGCFAVKHADGSFDTYYNSN